jgi:flagellar biosynthesis/type III secretory pathway M-ring protein FliF/YscJ
VENYKEALKHQEESIGIQKVAVRRQKMVFLLAGLLIVGLLVFLVLFAFSAKG